MSRTKRQPPKALHCRIPPRSAHPRNPPRNNAWDKGSRFGRQGPFQTPLSPIPSGCPREAPATPAVRTERERGGCASPSKARRAPPGRFPRSLIDRSAGSAPSCTPGTSPRATATRHAASPARAITGRERRSPTATRTEHPNSPQPPVSGLLSSIGASSTGSSPTPFCLASAPGPLAADRCSIVRGCSRPPPHLRNQAAPRLLPTVTAAGGRVFHPTRSYGASWRSPAWDDRAATVLSGFRCAFASDGKQARDGCGSPGQHRRRSGGERPIVTRAGSGASSGTAIIARTPPLRSCPTVISRSAIAYGRASASKRPVSYANTTAWTRSRRLSFWSMCVMCVLTVVSLM